MLKNIRTLDHVLKSLRDIVDQYRTINLVDVHKLSEILRDLGASIADLVDLRKEAYKDFQYAKLHSKETTESGKSREAEFKVPELDEIRKVLKHYSDLRQDLRTQISLWKNND